MKTLLLFRHALSTRSLDGYGDQILTASILPEGLAPIKKMAEFLKEVNTDANFVSPVLRCRQTAAVVTEVTGKDFVMDPILSEFQAEVPNETFAHLRSRCQEFLDKIETQSFETVLVCSHGGVIAGLQQLLLNGNFVEEELTNYPSTGELWIVRDHKLEAFDFN